MRHFVVFLVFYSFKNVFIQVIQYSNIQLLTSDFHDEVAVLTLRKIELTPIKENANLNQTYNWMESINKRKIPHFIVKLKFYKIKHIYMCLAWNGSNPIH